MKKLALSIAITSVLGLTACDDTTLEQIQEDSASLVAANEPQPKVSVVFDPSNGVLNVPNDLLFSGTQDFTLQMPDETAALEAGEAVDWGNPSAALGALDGWGTQNTFTIELAYEDGVTIDPASVMSGDSVALYEVVKYPSFTDPECSNTAMAGLICKGSGTLTFGQDYIASVVGGNIAITPLKPLKAGASYLVALTKNIKDSNGNPLNPSSTYASIEQDIDTLPIVHPDLQASELNETQAGIRLLQTMYNNFEDAVENFGMDRSNVVHTMVFTAQSAGAPTTDPLQITKLLNAQAFAQASATDPASVATLMASQGYTVAQALAGAGAIENDPDSAAYKLYSTADVYGAQISVPYYLDNADGSPLTGRWEAACDSGVMLASLTQEQMAALAANPGANHELCSSDAIGLADFGIDTQRHLTKFNPVPKVKSMETVDVQITIPNLENANEMRAAMGMPQLDGRPEAGWPVVILQHGITSKKEDMLAATGYLSMFGFATVAIDHPLHGSRGFEIDGMTINASTADPTHYLNLASLLTARDNIRQSVADALKLRLSINAMADATAYMQDGQTPPDSNIVDETRVYYMGHSLGAITGTVFTAIANTPANTGDEATDALINSAYKINASFLANGGGSIANFLTESGAFGPLVKASVVAGLGNDLSNKLMANLTPEMYPTIIAAAPECAAAFNDQGQLVDQNTALVCSYNYFVAAQATEAELAEISASIAQFSFAAQAVIEASDPTNYGQLLAATQTPVLMIEMVGDIARGGMNPADQVVPNAVATNPMAGTSGLANVIGLPNLTASMTDSGSVSGVVEYTVGGHSTVLSPATELSGAYPTFYALINQDINLMMNYYFLSDGTSVQIGETALENCLINGGGGDTCNP